MTQWRRTTQFLEKYTTHFIWKGCVCEREMETEQNCHILTPHSYGHQHCVFLVLLMLEGPAFCWVLAFSTTSCHQQVRSQTSGLQTNWLPVFTELYNSSIARSVSLKWQVWSSSSGNNGHAVHRSLPFGASVYDCTMGFYLVPYCQPSPPTRFHPITAIGMCHFRCPWNGMFGQVEGQYTTLVEGQ